MFKMLNKHTKKMESIVKLYSNTKNEIPRFLELFFSLNDKELKRITPALEWQKKYQNPLEIADIIGIFIENNELFDINMWVSFDKNVFINVTESNADQIIRYLYERYPW